MEDKAKRTLAKQYYREQIQDIEAEKTRLWHKYCEMKAEAELYREAYRLIEVEEAAERLIAARQAKAIALLKKLEKKENITLTKEVLDQLQLEL